MTIRFQSKPIVTRKYEWALQVSDRGRSISAFLSFRPRDKSRTHWLQGAGYDPHTWLHECFYPRGIPLKPYSLYEANKATLLLYGIDLL
jgi:hypothetical protein